MAGEGRRWEGVWDDVPNLKSLLLWAPPPAPPFRGVAERAVPDTWVPGLHFPSLVGEVTCKKGKGVVCRGNRRVVWEPGREVDSKGARARAEAMEETSELEKQNRP